MTRLRLVCRWALLAIMVAGLVAGVLLGRSYEANDLVAFSFIAYAAVGAIITRDRPDNAVGWIFLMIGALTGLGSASGALVAGIDSDSLTSAELLALWFDHWFWFPLLLLSTTFTVLLFPEGLPSRRWRPVLWAAIGSALTAVVMGMFQPTLTVEETQTQIDNPLSPFRATSGTTMESQPLFTALLVVALLCGLAGVASIVIRFRRSQGVERAQLRWFALAVSVAAFATFAPLDDALTWLVGAQAAEWVGMTIFASCLGSIPVACGIAITRHGLYEIDRVLSRTLSYTLVTAVVLATYTLVVTSVTRLLPDSKGTLAVAGATLAAAAVFRPVLGRVQNRVDHRFNRARFDAAHEVDAFAGRLRSSVGTPETVSDLEATLGRTLAPNALGVWTPAQTGGTP